MENLVLEDLRSHVNELTTLLKTQINYPYEILIKSTDEKTICLSGCQNKPIGEIIIEVYKPTRRKRYGVLIYPTRKCHLPILDCDNSGTKIELNLYKKIQDWFKTVSTSYERQSERTDTISRELIEKTSAVIPDICDIAP